MSSGDNLKKNLEKRFDQMETWQIIKTRKTTALLKSAGILKITHLSRLCCLLGLQCKTFVRTLAKKRLQLLLQQQLIIIIIIIIISNDCKCS